MFKWLQLLSNNHCLQWYRPHGIYYTVHSLSPFSPALREESTPKPGCRNQKSNAEQKIAAKEIKLTLRDEWAWSCCTALNFEMPKSKFKAGSKAQRKVCNLCCDQLEEQHEVLFCEGGCNSTVHRYCAGVTREHYTKLITDTEPFTCQYCTLRTYRAMVIQLQTTEWQHITHNVITPYMEGVCACLYSNMSSACTVG